MNLEDIRREYTLQGLDREQLNADPMVQFELWLQQAMAANLNADPTAMSLATVDAEGQPSQRIVLLKNQDASGFVFYTNLESHKAKDIAQKSKIRIDYITGSQGLIGALAVLGLWNKPEHAVDIATFIGKASSHLSL